MENPNTINVIETEMSRKQNVVLTRIVINTNEGDDIDDIQKRGEISVT